MPNLRDRDNYRDGAWDWEFLNSCFNWGIRPTDIDGFVERNGYCLYFEAKRASEALKGGQKRALAHLARQPKNTVLVIYGDPNKPVAMEHLGYGEKVAATEADIIEFVSAWYAMAEGVGLCLDEQCQQDARYTLPDGRRACGLHKWRVEHPRLDHENTTYEWWDDDVA